jgi:hypothetical protein
MHESLRPHEIPSTSVALDRERDALRIQAAALAAQQAALIEQEARLHQQRLTLEQQEAQLASHLEEKRLRLVGLRDRVQEAYRRLNEAREEHRERVAEESQALKIGRVEVDEARGQARIERRRLLALRRRLRQRLHRHWLARQEAMRRREQQLADELQRLERAAQGLEERKELAARERLRWNGQREIERRRLAAAWRQLRDERERWERERAQEREDLHDQAHTLERRAQALEVAEREQSRREEAWQARRRNLEQEAQGLENRLQNYRTRLAHRQEELFHLEGRLDELRDPEERIEPNSEMHRAARLAMSEWQSNPTPGPDAEPVRASGPGFAELEQIAGDLADQRWHLFEQVQRLARLEQQRRQRAAELDIAAERIQEREDTVCRAEEALERRVDELRLLTHSLDRWQAHLRMRSAVWQNDRERWLADLRGREVLLRRQMTLLLKLRKRWQSMYRERLERLAAQLAASMEVHGECVRLRDEWLERRTRVLTEQRRVAERGLALEQYRQECVIGAKKPVAAERRLNLLERRWSTDLAQAESEVGRTLDVLRQELARLDERFCESNRLAENVALREGELARRHSALDIARARAVADIAASRHEANRLRLQTTALERQLADTNAELERTARLLLDEPEVTAFPLTRAA